MATQKNADFNKMYQLLVSDESDLLGQIAYAVYKQQKIEKIQRFIDVNGRAPTQGDMSSFIENAMSENQRRFYKDRAVSLAQNFLNQSYAEELEKRIDAAKEEYRSKLETMARGIAPRSFMYGVWQSVFASFVFFAAGVLLLLATGGWSRIGRALMQLAQ